jgi:hypothetical protein
MKVNDRQLVLGLAGALTIMGGVMIIERHTDEHMAHWNPVTCPGVYLFMLGWMMFIATAWSGRGITVLLPSISVMVTAMMGQLGYARRNPTLKMLGGLGFLLSWFWMAWALGQGRGTQAQDDSRVFRYGGALGIVFAMNYLMMKQRKKGQVYGMGLPLFGISWASIAIGSSIVG